MLTRRMRFRDRNRAPHARSGRAATSSSSTGCRCSIWSKAARTGTRSSRWPRPSKRRRHDHQHRHRLARSARADHRHQRAARGFRLGHDEAQGRGGDPADHHQPHQHARGGRTTSSRTARPTWSRWRARCWPIPHWANKAEAGRSDDINTCIACNQACLDHVFQNKRASCLVNPRACHETELKIAGQQRKRIAVVGAGPAGLACATTLGERGHHGDPVRSSQRDWRPVQLRQTDSGQGRVPRDPALFPPSTGDHGVDVQLNQPRMWRHCSPAAMTRWCSPPASRRAR